MAEQSTNSVILELAPGVEMEFVRVPAGMFQMGSSPEQLQRAIREMGADSSVWVWKEQPQRTVELPEYWMGRYPVTNQQYQAFVQATRRTAPEHWEGGKIPPGKEQHPVVWVSWQDALAFCAWASQASGREIRLPSEAEWEKAAQGADGRTFPWGEDLPDEKRCNFANKVHDTTPVGRYSPQGDCPYGCADMAGNVWEWTSSLYQDYPYLAGDGREDLKSSGRRVLRGGSFYFDARVARCAYRGWDLPDFRGSNYGFRVVVRSLTPGL